MERLLTKRRYTATSLWQGVIPVIAVLLSSSLAGCQSDSDDDSARTQVPVEFSAIDQLTRAGEGNNEFEVGDRIGVFGWYTGQEDFDESMSRVNFMYLQEVKKDSTGWTYDPLKYWPNNKNDKVTFFAYHFRKGSITTGSNRLFFLWNDGDVSIRNDIFPSEAPKGLPQFQYQPEEKADEDFMLSDVVKNLGTTYDDKDKTWPTVNYRVPFVMHHMLARVVVVVRFEGFSPDQYPSLDGLLFDYLYRQATFYVDEGTAFGFGCKDLTDYESKTFEQGKTRNHLSADPLYDGSKESGETTRDVDLSTEFYLLPQPLKRQTGEDSTKQPYLEVTYSVKDAAGNADSSILSPQRIDLSNLTHTEWKMNTTYTYIIHIRPNGISAARRPPLTRPDNGDPTICHLFKRTGDLW